MQPTAGGLSSGRWEALRAPSARGRRERETGSAGGFLTSRHGFFSRRSFCRHPYFISRRPRRHGLRLDFIMGRWETPPGIPPGLPYLISCGGVGEPPHSSPESSVWKGLLGPPPLQAAYPAGSVTAPPTPPASPLRREAPHTPGPRATAPRGPGKGRAGQGPGEKDLAEGERQGAKGCTAPHGCTEKRGER